MKILQINSYYKYGSTGNIVFDITKNLKTTNIEAYVAAGNVKCSTDQVYIIKTKFGWLLSVLMSRILGKPGFYDRYSTKKLIKWIKEIQPDIIHLHNIHGFYLNVELLFGYLKSSGIKTIWTLHDCWPLTGHCAHYEYVGCNKWKTGCHDCEQLKIYPISYVDRSRNNYMNKKRIFSSLPSNQLTLVAPSSWLKNQIKSSYLNKYKTEVINNGIDLSVFYPRNSDFKKKYNLVGKKILLSVVFGYNIRKGLDHLNDLIHYLNDDYKIIVVGIQKKDKKYFNENILVLERTSNQEELAELYSCADVFLNLTLEDTFPTVNLEALACGTPVITYKTGGSPECIDAMTGMVVPKGDIFSLYDAIIKVTSYGKKKYSKFCVDRANQFFNKSLMVNNYISLYNSLYSNEIN